MAWALTGNVLAANVPRDATVVVIHRAPWRVVRDVQTDPGTGRYYAEVTEDGDYDLLFIDNDNVYHHVARGPYRPVLV